MKPQFSSSAFTTLKEKYFNGKAKLKAKQEPEKVKKDDNENEEEDDEDNDDELWDFVRESLDRLKSNIAHALLNVTCSKTIWFPPRCGRA